MARITIAEGYGGVVESIDTDKYDLSKPLAKADLFATILCAIEVADAIEKKETERRREGWRKAGYSV